MSKKVISVKKGKNGSKAHKRLIESKPKKLTGKFAGMNHADYLEWQSKNPAKPKKKKSTVISKKAKDSLYAKDEYHYKQLDQGNA